jgi:hypothetical protein
MDVTSKPLHDDSGNVTITPEMLDAHKPDELRRLEDFDSNAVSAYTLNVDEDDLLLWIASMLPLVSSWGTRPSIAPS